MPLSPTIRLRGDTLFWYAVQRMRPALATRDALHAHGDCILLDGSGDRDGDGICDVIDNCPDFYNPGQGDYDADGLADACDRDDDNDGVPDASDPSPRNAAINGRQPGRAGAGRIERTPFGYAQGGRSAAAWRGAADQPRYVDLLV